MTRSRRVTAALIAKYVNRASSLFTGAHAFHIRLSYRNSYSVAIFDIIFDIILEASPFIVVTGVYSATIMMQMGRRSSEVVGSRWQSSEKFGSRKSSEHKERTFK